MKKRREPLIETGGSCPSCGGVLVDYRFGFLCLDCRNQWQFNIGPDNDLSRKGFPVARREAR